VELFVYSNFETSAPQRSAHYTPDGRGDVLDSVANQNTRLSEVTATDIPNSDYLRIMFSTLGSVTSREALDTVETDRLGSVSKPRL
jgi:hypothetical protein